MISIRNFTSLKINEEFLKKVIKKVLEGEKIKDEAELSVAILGPGRMRKVNKRYKGKNRATDVLSFPETEIIFQGLKIGPRKEMRGLGEILICPHVIKKDARNLNISFKEELERVLIHGLLHLLGYTHEIDVEKEKMLRKEKFYLSKIKNKL